jgi:hypothetical protein
MSLLDGVDVLGGRRFHQIVAKNIEHAVLQKPCKKLLAVAML